MMLCEMKCFWYHIVICVEIGVKKDGILLTVEGWKCHSYSERHDIRCTEGLGLDCVVALSVNRMRPERAYHWETAKSHFPANDPRSTKGGVTRYGYQSAWSQLLRGGLGIFLPLQVKPRISPWSCHWGSQPVYGYVHSKSIT